MNNSKGKNHYNYKHGNYCTPHYCIEGCGRKISNITYIFGKRRCRSCSNKGVNNPNFKYFESPKCIECNKEVSTFKTKRCRKCANKHSLKNRLISRRSYKNAGNPNWQGGINKEGYPREFFKIRESILIRDNYQCQICNKKGNVVHHIDYCKDNYKKNNLITVCRKCHVVTNFNRDYWFAYFTYLMEH